MQTDIVDDLRKFSSEFFGEKNDPYFFICNCMFQSFFKLSAFMDDNTFHTCQTHACVGINVITDQIHFHRDAP